MLQLSGTEWTRTRGWTRRDMLRIGATALGGLTLADLMRQRAAAATAKAPRKDAAVILLWVHGGPSHLETYDLKPDAPDEFRGPFRPIRTKAAGVQVCELLPEHARIADKFTLLRSVAHDEADHVVGTRRFLSGYAAMQPGSNGAPLHPSLECGVNRMLGVLRNGLPAALQVGNSGSDPWRGPGFWGAKYGVPRVGVGRGLADTDLRIDAGRFDDRKDLLRRLDRMRSDMDASGGMDAVNDYRRQAYEVILSGRVREAFDLSKEPVKVRERYGEGWAQQFLLARRLVEAGVGFVDVSVPGQPPGSKSKAGNWDDHAVNWDMPSAMRERLPYYDRAVAALIEDVCARGLDERVLIVVAGEFGRTPRLERGSGNVGRDHWPGAQSILVAGGGRTRGEVIGATTSRGEVPRTERYDPHDFLASVYSYLGIDHNAEHLDLTGRPHPLTRGTPIPGMC